MSTDAHIPDRTLERPTRGGGLGVQYHPQASQFSVFAEADELTLRLWHPGSHAIRVVPMQPRPDGIWTAHAEGDYRGWAYSYDLRRGTTTLASVLDPWATLVHGDRAFIEAEHTPMLPRPPLHAEDAIIYELHVRDYTKSSSSGVNPDWQGRYLGLTEHGTHLPGDPSISTGIDHLIELGVTVVQLMPIQSFAMHVHAAYEWGYMPNDYFAPHSWYASELDLEAPIRNTKMMINALHAAGLRVTMDVVYNHTAELWPDRVRNLMALAPSQYYRFKPDGSPWNGSGCGNEIASETDAGRRLILDACKYWVERFKIDGFRFDLMGLIDGETMDELSTQLRAIDPSLLIYGEPWAAGQAGIEVLGKGRQRGRGWGVFNDDFRDGMRGGVFDLSQHGFLTDGSNRDAIFKGLRGSVNTFAAQPTESINYAESHDNHTLSDRLALNAERMGVLLTQDEIDQRCKLAVLILMLSQGIPFIHSGQEFGRSKSGHDNSYALGDGFNNIQWNEKLDQRSMFEFVRSAVRLRRDHPCLRLADRDAITRSVQRLPDIEANHTRLLAALIRDDTGVDRWEQVLVLLNGGASAVTVSLPQGQWRIAVNSCEFDATPHHLEPPTVTDELVVLAGSGSVLFQPRAQSD